MKTEKSIREGVEVKQNRFFIEGAYKYTYNNGQLAMSDHKAAATNFLNALERIPKQMEQYKTENAKLEKDLPTLREIVSGTWKKEDELKQLKSEVAVLERKIQLELAPPKSEAGQKQSPVTDKYAVMAATPLSATENGSQFLHEHNHLVKTTVPDKKGIKI